MSVSFIVKSGAIATSSVTVPTLSFLTYDHFFSLYEIEKEALEENSVLQVEPKTSSNLDIADVKFTKESKSWTCTIIGRTTGENASTVSNRDAILTKIKEKLPTSENSSDPNGDKKYNKKNLIKNCAKNRKSTSNDSVVAEVYVPLTKENSNWNFKEENFGSLFGKGFWF